MEVTTIQSWDEFDRLARELDGWAFRGHRETHWRLLSSLSRYLMDFVDDAAQWHQRELRAKRIFRRKAHNYLSDPRILEDDLRCMALMQHHGAPTRLLDFTKSPYVAAFFALEFATSDAAVFALNTPALWHAAPTSHPQCTREQTDPRKPGNYEKYFASNRYELIWIGEPLEMDRRLVAQSGTFVIPGVLNKAVEEILHEYSAAETLLRRIVLPGRQIRDEFMRSLYRMNITNATLFPDLEGLARSTAFELEVIWQVLAADPRQNRDKLTSADSDVSQ
jgi:hypothetical protein